MLHCSSAAVMMDPSSVQQKILMLFSLLLTLLLSHPNPIESIQQGEDASLPLTEDKLDYSTLRSLGVSCSPLDTCSTPRKEDSLETMTCECGERCAKYGTCCVDSPFVGRKIPNEHKEECTPVQGTDFSVFMVKRCKRGWRGDTRVRSRCQASTHTTVDPLGSVPVTDKVTQVTYRNRDCAVCNDVQNDVFPWVIALDVYADKKEDVDPSFKRRIIDNLIYSNESKTWGVWEVLNSELRTFIPMNIGYGIPEDLKPSVRHCRSNLVSTCVRTWHNITTRRLCESYMAAIYLTLDKTQMKSFLGFRNVHCAQCNYIPKEVTYSCSGRSPNAGRPPVSFSVLLDVNQSDGSVVGQSNICPSNEIYDPFFKKCKKMRCFQPGYVIRDGKCVPP